MFNGTTAEDIAMYALSSNKNGTYNVGGRISELPVDFTKVTKSVVSSKPFIGIKTVDPRCTPKRAHATDAGADLISVEDVTLYPNKMQIVDTGVSVAVPLGYAGLVYSRSGQGKLRIHLANSVGVVDSDYRGNIKVMIVNEGDNPYVIKAFETKIAQLVITPVVLATFSEWQGNDADWNNTQRGSNGFGSTN